MDDIKVTSGLFSINWKDALRGLLVASITAALILIQNQLSTGVVLNWKEIGTTAGLAGIGYLIKNFLTPATIQTRIKNSEINNNNQPKAK